jgi:two-component system cell cycle response regulator
MAEDFGSTTQVLKLDLAAPTRVLLVEDDELVLERLQSLVTTAGFEVSTAANGSQALAILETRFVPIVITDVNMPDMGGLTLSRAIRAKTWPGYVYIFVLTIMDAEADVVAGLASGADDYLSKRMSAAQLVARLQTAQRILTLEQSLKIALQENRRLAMTDALTGAPNRRYFLRRLDRELKRTHRFGGELSVLALDIDRFKQINDRYGHAAGDAVLKEFVRRLRRCLPRDTDWHARMGGEEFSVALPGTRLADAGIVAEHLRHAIAATPVRTAAGTIDMSVSIGIAGLEAVADRNLATPELLLRDSDHCLYQSKQQGRNRVSVASTHGAASASHTLVA